MEGRYIRREAGTMWGDSNRGTGKGREKAVRRGEEGGEGVG